MSGDRAGARLLRLVAPCAAVALDALWIRPGMLTWGATPEEATCTSPGDELVHDPDGGATMATALPAPPERVWPWLVQMGGGRAGWYSWDWLDNNGEPSADRIVPEWQSLEVGRQLKGPANRWTVAVVEQNRILVLQGATGCPPATLPIRGPVPCLGRTWTDLGFPLAAGSRRADPPGDLYPEPGPPAAGHPAVRPAGGGTRALHHADPPVPQPAQRVSAEV